VQVFTLADGKLASAGAIKVNGGSAAVRFADKPVAAPAVVATKNGKPKS